MVFSFFKKKNKQEKVSEEVEVEIQSTDDEEQHNDEIEVVAEKESATEIETTYETPQQEQQPQETQRQELQQQKQPQPQEKKKGYFARLKAGLAKTGAGLGNIFLGKKALDDDLLEDLETVLLMADVGIEATQEIIDDITDGISRKSLKDQEAVVQQLKTTMTRILSVCDEPLTFEKKDGKPFVLLMVGINGAGKTTTIGKISQKLTRQNSNVSCWRYV